LNKATEYEKDTIPNELQDPEILQAFNTIETMSLNTKEREYYEAEKKVMRDRIAVMQTAIENAVDETNIKIVINMIKEGFANDIIFKMTKFSDKQINEIRNKLDNK
jgi:predicted transposase/invertase (TIGR01784 family)